MTPAVERLLADRRAQGFGERVDPSIIERVARILTATSGASPPDEEGRPHRRPVPSSQVPTEGHAHRTSEAGQW